MSNTSASKFMLIVFEDKSLLRFWDDAEDHKKFILWLLHVFVISLLLAVLHLKGLHKK